MPEEWEETRPEDEEDGGGEVKSFLEHLEDLRWVLIKSGAAVMVAFIVCLLAGNRLMDILLWPLNRAWSVDAGADRYLTLMVGTNRMVTARLGTNDPGFLLVQTNQQHLVFRLAPMSVGTNMVLALQPVHENVGAILPKTRVQLLNLSPAGGFIVAFQLAMYGGIVLAAPFIIYCVGQFVLPALKRKEKKYLFRGLGVGSLLFFTGVIFCYLVLMPLALNASRAYSNWLGIAADQWRAEDFISFECKFMLGMGLGFELPVVLLILVKLGILDYARLSAMRKYMIVINLVLGAVLTTPEVMTQIMMAVPLQVLYEITVWIAWYWERRDKKRQELEEAAAAKPAE